MEKDRMNLDIDGPQEIGCLLTTGGHFVVQLHQDKNWNTDEMVYLMQKEVDIESFAKIKRIHEVTNHKSENNMLHAYSNDGKLTDKIRQSIKNVVDICKVC
jgi:hypothetical protein